MNLGWTRTGSLFVFGVCVGVVTAFGQHTKLTGFADDNGGQHLFYLDGNSHLNQIFYLGAVPWDTQDLTALYGGNTPAAGSALTSYLDVYSGQHVYYLDSNSHVNHITWGGTTWQPEDLTAAYGGAPAAGNSIASFYDNYTNEDHVFYIDSNGHIIQIFRPAGSTVWQVQDLTAQSGAHAAASGSPLAAFVDFGQGQHLAYLDSNHHLNQVYYNGDYTWFTEDITGLFGGNMPASTSHLTAYIDPALQEQHIVYEDGNQHVNQVTYIPAGYYWSSEDMTAMQGGNIPEAGSDLATYIDAVTLPHIVYLDANGHINQFFYPGSGSTWYPQDLTAISGGTPAVVGSKLVAFPVYLDPGHIGQHVGYLDANDNVNQVWYPPTGGSQWYWQNLTSLFGGNTPALRPVFNVSTSSGSSQNQ